jgi:polyhydroxyalkanoate synthesis regulator phasin
MSDVLATFDRVKALHAVWEEHYNKAVKDMNEDPEQAIRTGEIASAENMVQNMERVIRQLESQLQVCKTDCKTAKKKTESEMKRYKKVRGDRV